MKLSEDAKKLLAARYCRKGEQPNDVYKRVARVLGNSEDLGDDFLQIMEEGKFLPNSPCLRNAGHDNMMKACFVLKVEDNMGSIFKTLQDSALISKAGGGCGFNFSKIREKDAPLSKGGTASGAVSFIELFNSVTNVVKQGSYRRGASIGIMNFDHPEIVDFIKSKIRVGDLTNFNISVMGTNDFMKTVKEGGFVELKSRVTDKTINVINAADLFNIIVFCAWNTGDPGMLFFDRINEDNIYNEKLICCNPCGEQPLLPYESCCLGSINLNEHIVDGAFDTESFINTVKMGTRFLLSINKHSEFPIPELYKMSFRTNRIGLGIMGFADALIKMKIMYDSQETLDLIDKLGKIMKTEAKKIAYSSASVLTVAPTGSLSILANCSPSIEPIFSENYTRHLVFGKVKEKREYTKYLRVAHEITPEWHLKIQAQWQKWIDSGVSKSVNVPHNAGIQEIHDIFYRAWELGCKGITVFRDGCRGGDQVYKTNCEGDSCYL